MTPAHGFDFPPVIDSTMRKTFASCEQKWFYEFVEGLAPSAFSIHLHAGGVFAKGLEVFRKAFYLHEQPRESALDAARLAMLIEWGDYEPMCSFDPGAEGQTKCLDALFDALDFYMTVWPPETDLVQPLIRGDDISVEFSFAMPIPGTRHPQTGDPILYAGRFDMLGLYDGVMYVVDEKTAKQLGQTWQNQWEMRSQFTGYCWAAQAHGFPVGGAIVRGISFLSKGFGSAQTITFREDWKIARWLEQLQRDAARMIACWESGKPMLNLDDSCNSFAGCSYQRLCNSPDPTPWKSEYVLRRWNPLNKV